MINPFNFRELPLAAPFCDRKKELRELFSHAQNRANAVIISPRRFGKTSLAKRVQGRLADNGVLTAYADFFGVDSVEDAAARLAGCIYAVSGKRESLLKKAADFISSWRPVLRPDREYGMVITAEPAGKKSGIELLEDTMAGIGRFIGNQAKPLHIVLDEFQEITELKESLRIEGLMRSHIQRQDGASYFFVGSRRRLLLDIFNERKRPFYRSAVNYALGPLPQEEAAEFIVERFRAGGKRCPEIIAKRIVELVRGYPFYIQRIPYSIYEVSGKTIGEGDYRNGFAAAIEEEKTVFEVMLQSLATQQIRLLSAVSLEPSDAPFSAAYMARHNLGSVGGVQGGIKKLITMDYIEKRDGVFYLTDPVFGIWLRRLKE